LPAAGEADEPADTAPELLPEITAAAVQGRTALGERAGQRDERPGRGSREEPFVKGPMCADLDGFSLHAAVRLPAGCREQLEQLCRYAARSPIAEERLSLQPDGNVLYKLKRRYADGSTHVKLTPFALLERLCAFVPAPHRRLVTYHGVLAPAASDRHRVVPGKAEDAVECRHGKKGKEVVTEAPAGQAAAMPEKLQSFVPHAPAKLCRRRPRLTWAELMRRVFAFEVLVCPRCQGPRRVLAAVLDPDAIGRILRCLGLPTEVPAMGRARSPPERDLPW
jgi:hypothetical protein